MKLSQRDPSQITVHEHDEEFAAKRVIIVGAEMPEIKIPEIKLPDSFSIDTSKLEQTLLAGFHKLIPNEQPSFQTMKFEIPPFIQKEVDLKVVEVPTIIKETEIKVIEVPVIHKEIEIVRVEVPVVHTEIKLVEVPVIVKETEYKDLPKSIKICLVAQMAIITLTTLLKLFIK